MTNIQKNFYTFFCLFLIVSGINFCDGKVRSMQKSPTSFNFEHIKNDLFMEENYINLWKEAENQCTKELKSIRKGILKSEQWAIKRKLIKPCFVFE